MQTLNEIGLKTGTDKSNKPGHGHGYLDFYEQFLEPWRHNAINLIEVGIGGYEFIDRGGESLRMWDAYFDHPATRIAGVDLYEKKLTGLTERVTCYQFDQTASYLFEALTEGMGIPDIVIDDASHVNGLSIQTFNILFGLLKPGGIYIWEDIHTSFWPDYNGNPVPMTPDTALHFLSRLAYGLQADTITEENREPWDGHVESMHFMRNTCVIIKRKQ